MPDDLMSKIKDTESEARRVIEEARKEARRIISETKAKAERCSRRPTNERDRNIARR